MEGRFMVGDTLVIHHDTVITVKGSPDCIRINGAKCTIFVGDESIPLYPQILHLEGTCKKFLFENPPDRKCIATDGKFSILLDPEYQEPEMKCDDQNYVTAAMVTTDSKCSICLEKFHMGETCMWLPCSHVYHDTCISRWGQRSELCPLCKLRTIPLLV